MTALFAANDLMALGALRELKRRNLDVPGDISLAGFDDIRIATHLHPSLTTVRVPMYELGREGFFLAMRMLTGDRPGDAPAARRPAGARIDGAAAGRLTPSYRSSMIDR